MIFEGLFCSLVFIHVHCTSPVHRYFYPSTTGFTHPNDGCLHKSMCIYNLHVTPVCIWCSSGLLPLVIVYFTPFQPPLGNSGSGGMEKIPQPPQPQCGSTGRHRTEPWQTIGSFEGSTPHGNGVGYSKLDRKGKITYLVTVHPV